MESLARRFSQWEIQNLQRIYWLSHSLERGFKKTALYAFEILLFFLFLTYSIAKLLVSVVGLMFARAALYRNISPGHIEEAHNEVQRSYEQLRLR